MLVHSSVSGARQWRRLMDYLKAKFHVRAVNLFGYSKTAPWPGETVQTLTIRRASLKPRFRQMRIQFCFVGHSFGGSVAMKAAAQCFGCGQGFHSKGPRCCSANASAPIWTDRTPFKLWPRWGWRRQASALSVALRAALSFDTRVELIWMSPLSVSGGIVSSQKGSLRARIRTDYYLTNPHKVADRRKPAPMDGPTSR